MIGCMELAPSMGVEHRERKSKADRKKKRKEKGGAGWLIMTPWRPVLMAILKKKGLPHKGTNKELAMRFYKEVLKKPLPSMYEGDGNYYDANFTGMMKGHTEGGIDIIVGAIITWIKNLKKKKENGEPMTAEEEKLLEISESAARSGEQMIKDEAEEGIGAWILENKMIVLVGAAVVAYFLLKK